MKKIFKRTLATIMVVLMVLTSAPLQGIADLEWSAIGDWFSSKASAADEKLTAEEAVDIYMKDESVWAFDSLAGLVYSAEYIFLDLDFDGILEMVTSIMSGTGKVINNKFYKIDMSNQKVVNVSIGVYGFSQSDIHNLKYLCENIKTGKMFYFIPGRRPDFNESWKDETIIYCDDGVVYDYRLFGSKTVKDYSNKETKTYYKYTDYGQRSTELSASDYTKERDAFFLECIDKNLRKKIVDAKGYKSASISKRRELLIESYKAFGYDINYRETYGWPLSNYEGSFGYPQGYEWPVFERYKEVYGTKVSATLEGMLYQGVNKILKWSGNCFGLSILSLANYYGKINLKDYFKRDADYLYDYGFDSIVTYGQGKYPGKYYSVAGNKAVISLIERAQVMQSAVELEDCRVFSDDKDYSSLIEHFSSNGKPLLVCMDGGTSGHTMILTAEEGVVKIDNRPGWYRIRAYDTNAPYAGALLGKPSKVYQHNDSYLNINPTTGDWEYYAVDKVQYGNWYYVMKSKLLGETITFYDVSKLDSSFFTKKLSLWYKKVQLTFDLPEITIKNKKGETLISIVDNKLKELNRNCDYKVLCAGEGSNLVTFYTDETDLVVNTDSDAQLWGMSKDFYIGANLSSKNELTLDFDDFSISSKALSGTSNKNSIAAQNVAKNNTQRIDFDAKENDYCTLTVTDKGTVDTNINKSKYTITTENNSPALGKTSKITPTQTTKTVKLTWKAVSGANIYRVYQKNGSSWKKLADVTGLNYTVKNLKAGTKYSFAVKAGKKVDGKITWASGYTSINTATKAVAPSKITATQTASTIKLTWNKVSGATGYRVYQKVDGKWKTLKNSTTSTSYTIKDLKTGTKYTFAIKPYIKTDSGNVWSAYTQFTTATKPVNPTLKVTAPSKGKLTVNWKAVSGAESYQLWYKTGNGSYKLYKTYTKAGTLNFKNLKSGTKYTFAVRAVIKTDGGNVRSGYKAVSATVK